MRLCFCVDIVLYLYLECITHEDDRCALNLISTDRCWFSRKWWSLSEWLLDWIDQSLYLGFHAWNHFLIYVLESTPGGLLQVLLFGSTLLSVWLNWFMEVSLKWLVQVSCKYYTALLCFLGLTLFAGISFPLRKMRWSVIKRKIQMTSDNKHGGVSLYPIYAMVLFLFLWFIIIITMVFGFALNIELEFFF